MARYNLISNPIKEEWKMTRIPEELEAPIPFFTNQERGPNPLTREYLDEVLKNNEMLSNNISYIFR